MKKLRNIFIAAVALFGLLAPVTVLAATNDAACEGLALTGQNVSCDNTGGPSVEGIVEKVINILSIVVGVVSVIMIIIGGLKYVTSSGDSGNVTSAKNTILYAIIGLVVVAMAQAIVRFVLTNLD